jgi:hypothetical protein
MSSSSDSESEEEYDNEGAKIPKLRRQHQQECTEKAPAWFEQGGNWPGLAPPQTADGARVNGKNKRRLKRKNKAKRIAKQLSQEPTLYWKTQKGKFEMPEPLEELDEWEGEMCPNRHTRG